MTLDFGRRQRSAVPHVKTASTSLHQAIQLSGNPARIVLERRTDRATGQRSTAIEPAV
jgi:hypothetical protein